MTNPTPKTILVVDDQKSMCWVLSKVLTEAGFAVKTAGDSAGALSLVNNSAISAVIIDYRLPDGNGLELFRKLRQQGFHLPALLITSYGSTQLRQEALDLGFAAYFDKPFQNLALINVLKEVLKDEQGIGSR